MKPGATSMILRNAPTRTLFRNCEKFKLLQRRSQVTCYVEDLINFWFFHSKSKRSKDLVLNIW